MNKEFHIRKHIRLNDYDYSSAGAYFITICANERKCIFSKVVGRGLAPAKIEYSIYGKIVEEQLLLLKNRYPFLSIDNDVIMPNHIHILLTLGNDAAGASPRPTVIDIICAYKSLTTKECKKCGKVEKIFQPSFYDHVVRNGTDFEDIYEYIQNNPQNWITDEMYREI